MPRKLAAVRHWKKSKFISELRSFMGFCNYYSGYVGMYANLWGPLQKMLQVGKFDGRKGSKKKLAWTTEAEGAFDKLKEQLFDQLRLFLVDTDRGFVLRTDASDYAVGGVSSSKSGAMEHMSRWTFRVESWRKANVGRVLRGRRRLMPLCARSGNCRATSDFNQWWYVPIINHFRVGKRSMWCSLGSSDKASTMARDFSEVDLSVVYVPKKDNTVANCLSHWASPAGKAWMDISSRGDAEETEEAKRIIELEKAMEEGNTKCLVIMASKAELSQRWDARV